MTRIIEAKSEYITGTEYEIIDNAVLEYDISNRMSSHHEYRQKDIDEKISRLKIDIQWNNNYNNRIKYFIMFRHSDLFHDNELRQYFRSELERIKASYKAVEEIINKL